MAAKTSERLYVLLFCQNDKEKSVFSHMDASLKIEELRQEWLKEHNVKAVQFEGYDGTYIGDDMSIGEVTRDRQGNVNMSVEESCEIFVCQEADQWKQLCLFLSRHPNDVFHEIRDLIGEPESRIIRLRRDIDDKEIFPLKNDRSFRDQGIEANDHLRVELGYKVLLKDAWNSSRQSSHVVFESSKNADLLKHVFEDDEPLKESYEVEDDSDWPSSSENEHYYSSEETDEEFDSLRRSCKRLIRRDTEDSISSEKIASCRLVIGSKRMRSDASVFETLKMLPKESRRLTEMTMRFEYPRQIITLINGQMKTVTVWPGQKVSKLLRRVGPRVNLIFNGKLLEEWAAKTTFKELGIEDGSVVSSAFRVTVLVRGRGHFVWLGERSLVQDLKEAVAKIVGNYDFRLECGSEMLDNLNAEVVKDKLLRHGVFVSDELISIEVTIPKLRRTCQVHSGVSLSYSELVQRLVKETGVKWGKLLKYTYRCHGCQRRISRNEEAFQSIPDNCCSVRSTCLIAELSTKTKDTLSQGETWINQRAKRTKMFGFRPHPRPKAVQTSVPALSASTSIIVFSEDEITGLDVKKNETVVGSPKPTRQVFSNQHPPLFWVRDRTDYQNVKTHGLRFSLPSAPTVGEVRKAVAKELGRAPKDVKMERLVGRYGGVKVYSMCDMTGQEKHFFDRKRVIRFDDVNSRQFTRLEDDRVEFSMPPAPYCCDVRIMLR